MAANFARTSSFSRRTIAALAASRARTGFRIYVVASRGGVVAPDRGRVGWRSSCDTRIPSQQGVRQRQRQPGGRPRRVRLDAATRQFLVTVMVHSGCFLRAPVLQFAETVRGQNSRDFIARLVARGFARAIEPGPVRRGRLYHVHHKPLYEAIGQADNRNRRLRTIGRMVERVMILDAVLGNQRCWWLSPNAISGPSLT